MLLLKHYFMPAEWHHHTRCWMLWPFRRDNWRNNAYPAQQAFLNVATSIANFEDVIIGVPKIHLPTAQKMLTEFIHHHSQPLHKVELLEMESNDAWMRDVGPTFLLPRLPSSSTSTEKNQLLGMDWIFNAWGEKYLDWKADDCIAKSVIDFSSSLHHRADFILEGGSIHVDGEGTILTTEECLLNPNRNPSLSKEEIEVRLLAHLGGEKVIWLPLGLAADDDTNGHIDNIACFTKPGEVLLSWTDDVNDDHFARCQAALQVLQSTTDAKNRPLNVVKIPIPPPMYYATEDFEGLITEGHEESEEEAGNYGREVGKRLAASYVNFYIANKGIVCPAFHPDTDGIARDILQQCFPDFQIIQIPGRDILLGGGNIHCITQQEPSL